MPAVGELTLVETVHGRERAILMRREQIERLRLKHGKKGNIFWIAGSS